MTGAGMLNFPRHETRRTSHSPNSSTGSAQTIGSQAMPVMRQRSSFHKLQRVRKYRRIYTPTRADDRDRLAPAVVLAGQRRGERDGAGGFEHEFEMLEGHRHRVERLRILNHQAPGDGFP